jgi:hypothetical protein
MVIINFLEKRFEEVIAGFGVVLMALMVFFQVVMRYVFSTPVSWSDEIAQYCMLWSVYLSVSWAGNHFPSQKILGIIELASNTMSQGHHGAELYESSSGLEKVFWLNLSGKRNQEFEYDSIKLLLTDLKKDIVNFDVILIMSNKDSKKISEPVIDLIKSK